MKDRGSMDKIIRDVWKKTEQQFQERDEKKEYY